MLQCTDSFRSILHCGDPSLPAHEKARILDDIREILIAAGCDSNFACRAARELAPLQHVLLLVYNRRLAPEDGLTVEGRTCYHRIAQTGGAGPEFITVTVKGIGSQSVFFREGAGRFPGFPDRPETLFFDYANHPRRRMWGIETMRWGTLELASCAVIFSLLSRAHGWKTLGEALRAGVSVPIGRAEFSELSRHLWLLVSRREEQTRQNPAERWSLRWPGHKEPFISVGHIVPDNRRMLRPSELLEKPPASRMQIARELVNTEWSRTQARTLRNLLNLGVTYSWVSSHGQNLYRRGLVANADYSDSVFLADYHDEIFRDEDGGSHRLPVPAQQMSLVYSTLSRNDGMTPLPYPRRSLGITPEDVEACLLVFWQEYLGGIASPDAIRRIPGLYSFFHPQIALAAAFLAVTHHQTELWQEASERRRALLASLDPSGGASDESEYKLRSNLSVAHALLCDRALQDSDPIGAQCIVRFLLSGDVEPCERHPILKRFFALREAAQTLEPEARARLLEAVGTIQENRNFEDLTGPSPSPRKDILDLFAYRHLEKANAYYLEKNVENGHCILEGLAMITSHRFIWRNDDDPFSPYELRDHSYARKLLIAGNPHAVVSEIRFLDALAELVCWKRYGAAASNRSRIVDEYCRNKGIPSPYDAVLEVLACAAGNPEIRSRMAEFIQAYADTTWKIAEHQDEYPDLVSVYEEASSALDQLVSRYKEIPELRMFHAYCWLDPFEDTNANSCDRYYQQVLEYFESNLKDRCQQLGYDLNQFSGRLSPDERARRRMEGSAQVASKYRELGLHKLADFYEGTARGGVT